MTQLVRRPLFFTGGAGRCYATLFLPADDSPDRQRKPAISAVLFVPPFGEEMNKSRRMAALLGASVAMTGRPLLVPDLWGTGDSEGDFADARWEIWREDLRAAAELLHQRGVEVLDLVALRLGAVLASGVTEDLPIKVRHLLMWQPVISGGQYLTQFLRLRVASALAEGGGETVRAIREELARAGVVEIGGYELSLPLAMALEAMGLESGAPDPSVGITWVDVSNDPGRPMSPAGQKVVDAWRARGSAVRVEHVRGDAFWATQEITELPEMIDLTVRLLTSQAG